MPFSIAGIIQHSVQKDKAGGAHGHRLHDSFPISAGYSATTAWRGCQWWTRTVVPRLADQHSGCARLRVRASPVQHAGRHCIDAGAWQHNADGHLSPDGAQDDREPGAASGGGDGGILSGSGNPPKSGLILNGCSLNGCAFSARADRNPVGGEYSASTGKAIMTRFATRGRPHPSPTRCVYRARPLTRPCPERQPREPHCTYWTGRPVRLRFYDHIPAGREGRCERCARLPCCFWS